MIMRLTTGAWRHAGSGKDEVHKEFVGAVADHREIAIFSVSDFGTELNLKLVFVFLLCHIMRYVIKVNKWFITDCQRGGFRKATAFPAFTGETVHKDSNFCQSVKSVADSASESLHRNACYGLFPKLSSRRP